MTEIDLSIQTIDKTICKNIDRFDDSERGLLSQNIMAQLRNFVEHVALKAYSNGQNIDVTYPNLQEGIKHVKSRADLKFLSKFHKLLQPVASHYTLDEENSERLMLKYYEFLLRIKSYLKNNFGIDILENIDKFPINTDSVTKEYYEKIAYKIDNQVRLKSSKNDRYYIQKIKPFFVDYQVYYEVTFTRANDNVSKFDRVIAFTKLDISPNYAVRLHISDDNIDILGKSMPIHIIDHWEVSIRPCELDNFSRIFGTLSKTYSTNREYQNLMRFLTGTGFNLVDLIDFTDDHFQSTKEKILQDSKVSHLFQIFDKCRKLVNNNANGSNIIRYLLYTLNNKVIKQQYQHAGCGDNLSNLHLKWGCIPFDQMPFATSPVGHNPRLSDLFDCIDATNREHELFARLIKNNTEMKAELYTPKKDIKNFDNIDGLINKYNRTLYYKHTHRKLQSYKDFIYITGYESDTVEIIKMLKELELSGVKGYSSYVDSWLKENPNLIDCEDKKNSLRLMFENSKVALIYGSAGTGKSTMINHISQLFNDRKKLYLANTNPATDNLKRKVQSANCEFKTIAKFIADKRGETSFDILFIDECSTVNNADMVNILNKASFTLLVLVGDIFQIESINFGNWFSIAQSFIPKTSVTELTKPYRSKNSELLKLWEKVRYIGDDILEHITTNDYSIALDESIFVHSEDDEIILCLNYGGLYGVNNINKFLQGNNGNKAILWGTLTYKIGDPILFNDTKRFGPSIYNNLKGKILDIEILEEQIRFDIEIDKTINEMDTFQYDFQLLDNLSSGNSVIRFLVNKYKSSDEDDDSSDAVVPFQIAYAVSIHKAQGLEYNSVKVVITDEVEEMITHNIFYTAITRAKEKLKIYWSPETENKILNSLEKRDSNRDVGLLKAKMNL